MIKCPIDSISAKEIMIKMNGKAGAWTLGFEGAAPMIKR